MKKWVYCLGLIVLLMLSWLIQAKSSVFYSQPILTISSVTIEDDQQIIQGTMKNGAQKGEHYTLVADYHQSAAIHAHYQQGQQLLLTQNGTEWQILSQKRDGYLFFLFGLFIGLVLMIGGKKGLRALLSVVINTGLIIGILWINKQLPQFSLLFLMLLFTIVSVIFTMGISYTFQAIDGRKVAAVLISVLSAFMICWVSMNLLHDQGLRYEEMSFVTRPYRSIYLASLLIGAIGASMDNVIMIIASLDELQRNDPKIEAPARLAAGRAMAQDTTSSMVNVLLFAYLSGSMPAVLFYLANGWAFQQAFAMHASLELLRALCGGFALVLSVPITLWIYEIHQRRCKQ